MPFLFFFFLTCPALAVDVPGLPLYELGIFLGTATLPDYPAASQSRQRTLPLPLVHYHGDLLRADDENGTRFRYLKEENFELDLSFAGSFPTDTGNNDARTGMPNLDWTIEVGPRLIYYVYRNPEVAKLRIGIPVRSSFATDFLKWYGVGYVFAPTIQLDKYHFLFENLNCYIHYTAHFISEGVADFFYRIDPQFQTPARMAYESAAGFLSHEVSVALKYRFTNKNIIIGAQYSDFSQSANTQSYLHRNNTNWSYIMAFSWILHESSTRGIR